MVNRSAALGQSPGTGLGRWPWRLWALLAALLLALAPSPAAAADARQGDLVVVGPSEVVDDDLYAFGRSVEIQGTVRGDVVAFAASVSVSGTVTGNVTAGGGGVTIPGRVGGSVRAAGGRVAVGGTVGGDLLVGGGSLTMGSGATVGRDLLLGGGTAVVDGQVRRRLLAGTEDLIINGAVGSDVRAEVGTLRVSDRATVGGDLSYRSDDPADIAPGARIQGTVDRMEPRLERPDRPATGLAGLIGYLQTLVGLFGMGLAFILLFPGFGRRTEETLRQSPWASLGLGLAVLVAVPIAALLLFILGLFLGGWWLALMALALYGISAALGFVIAGAFVGRWILGRAGRPELHPLLGLLAGLAVLLLVGIVPVVGPMVVVAALLFGLGALVVAGARTRMAPATG